MLWQIFSFEVRYWLRSWTLWIFFLIIAAMVFFATATDYVTLGDALTNTYRNAPFVIQNYYSFMGLFAILMATAFVNSAAARDFNFNTHQIIFSTPMRRFDFLIGRFLGATIVSCIPIFGVSAGVLLAKLMPWIVPERWGPVVGKRTSMVSSFSPFPTPLSLHRFSSPSPFWRATKLLPLSVPLAFWSRISPPTASSRTSSAKKSAPSSIPSGSARTHT
jgi:hypothetical protein